MTGYLKFRHAALAAGIALTLVQAGCAQVETTAAPDGYQVLDPADIVGEFTGDPEASLICQTLSEIAADPPADLFRQYEGPDDPRFVFEAYGHVFFDPDGLAAALAPADSSRIDWEPMTTEERRAAYWDINLARSYYDSAGVPSLIGYEPRTSPKVRLGIMTRDEFIASPPVEFEQEVMTGPDVVHRIRDTGYEFVTNSNELTDEITVDASQKPNFNFYRTQWRMRVHLIFESYRAEGFPLFTMDPYTSGSVFNLVRMRGPYAPRGEIGGFQVRLFDPDIEPTEAPYTYTRPDGSERIARGPTRPVQLCAVLFKLRT